MALTKKEYEKFYKETGSGNDKITTANKDYIKTAFEYGATHGFHDIMDDYRLGPIIYMVQQMQDELDYLRTEISTNKDKTGISSSQASAITANEKAVASNDSAIKTNTTNIATNVTNIDSKLTKTLGKNQSLTCLVEEDKNGDHTLFFMLSIKDEKSGKIVRKTAKLEFK